MPCPAKELGVIEAFVAVDDSRTKNGSAWRDDGARLLVARSGTACRAPTGEMLNAKGTMWAMCAK